MASTATTTTCRPPHAARQGDALGSQQQPPASRVQGEDDGAKELLRQAKQRAHRARGARRGPRWVRCASGSESESESGLTGAHSLTHSCHAASYPPLIVPLVPAGRSPPTALVSPCLVGLLAPRRDHCRPARSPPAAHEGGARPRSKVQRQVPCPICHHHPRPRAHYLAGARESCQTARPGLPSL